MNNVAHPNGWLFVEAALFLVFVLLCFYRRRWVFLSFASSNRLTMKTTDERSIANDFGLHHQSDFSVSVGVPRWLRSQMDELDQQVFSAISFLFIFRFDSVFFRIGFSSRRDLIRKWSSDARAWGDHALLRWNFGIDKSKLKSPQGRAEKKSIENHTVHLIDRQPESNHLETTRKWMAQGCPSIWIDYFRYFEPRLPTNTFAQSQTHSQPHMHRTQALAWGGKKKAHSTELRLIRCNNNHHQFYSFRLWCGFSFDGIFRWNENRNKIKLLMK